MINFESFSKVKLLVIGDIILDHYKIGSVLRLSPEAPVPLVNIEDEIWKLGGAANVAHNIKALGCNVDLIGLIGNDTNGNMIRQLLQEDGISVDNLVETSGIRTTVKTRIIGSDQHIVRYDKEDVVSQACLSIAPIVSRLMDNNYDLVIISDYGKGVITNPTINILRKVVDTKKMIADVKPKNKRFYKNMFCITPNYTESQIMSKSEATADEIARLLKEELKLSCVIITLSSDGSLLLDENDVIHHIKPNFYQPSSERHYRIDVTGAGDTLLSVFSAGIASGLDAVTSLRLGNIAASIIVTKLGTSSCSIDELKCESEKNGLY